MRIRPTQRFCLLVSPAFPWRENRNPRPPASMTAIFIIVCASLMTNPGRNTRWLVLTGERRPPLVKLPYLSIMIAHYMSVVKDTAWLQASVHLLCLFWGTFYRFCGGLIRYYYLSSYLQKSRDCFSE